MKRLLALAALAASLLAAPALAATCASNPYTLTNGATADATQVMANFNNLLNCANNNVAPLNNPTFTGSVVMPTLSVGGTSAFGGNAAFSGAISVSGLTSTTSIDAATPNSATTGGYRLRANAVSGHAYLQVLDSGGSSQWGLLDFTNGATTLSGGLTVANGLTVSAGSVSLPANTIPNAALAQMAANTFKGNNTGGTANAADLTVTQAAAMLPAVVGDSGSGGAKGSVPAPAAGDKQKVLTGAGTFQMAGATAWAYVTVNQAGGTCTVVSSFNIAACTRSSQGNIGFSFTSAMANANYAPFAMAQCLSINASCTLFNPFVSLNLNTPPNTAGFNLHIECANCNSGTGPMDPDGLYVVVFGN